MDFRTIITMSLLVFSLIFFYAIGIYLNKKTPLPENCELPSLKCEHCSSSSCSYSESNRVEKIKAVIKTSLKNKNSGEGAINE